MSRTQTRGVAIAVLGAVIALAGRPPRPLGAQQDTTRGATTVAARRLSLEDALHAAEAQSEAVQIARAGLTRAQGQWYQARSQYLPQLSATAAYARTLRSQFQGVSFGGGADTSTTPKPQALCAPSIPANATAAEIQAALAQASTCQAAGSGFNFSSVGFGAPNQWTFGFNFSQNVFAGGRISGQYQAANASVTRGDDRGRGPAGAARARRHPGVLRRRARRSSRLDSGSGAVADGRGAPPDPGRAAGREPGGVRSPARAGDARQPGARRAPGAGRAPGRVLSTQAAAQLADGRRARPRDAARRLDGDDGHGDRGGERGELARADWRRRVAGGSRHERLRSRAGASARAERASAAGARESGRTANGCRRFRSRPAISASTSRSTSFRSGTTRVRTGRSAPRCRCRSSRAAAFAATR